VNLRKDHYHTKNKTIAEVKAAYPPLNLSFCVPRIDILCSLELLKGSPSEFTRVVIPIFQFSELKLTDIEHL